MSIAFTDGFLIGSLSLYCNAQTREDLFRLKINRVRVVRRADGYYAQFCFDADRKEEGIYTGNVVGLDLGLKFFTKDQNDNAVIYPGNNRVAACRKYLLVTQKCVGEDTAYIREDAPQVWQYPQLTDKLLCLMTQFTFCHAAPNRNRSFLLKY